jgi:predicted ATPase
MQQADGQVLCDDAIFRAAGASLAFDALPPLRVKASDRPVPVYRPAAATVDAAIKARLDLLPPDQQLLVKVASVIGPTLEVALLQAVYPFPKDRLRIPALIDDLASSGILVRVSTDNMPCYSFQNAVIREYAYQSLLFAQRRDLHREVATWYERERGDDLGPVLAVLGDHWAKADEPTKAVHYLERAGQWAHDQGDYDAAERLLRASISLEASAGEISESFHKVHDLPVVGHDVTP